MKTGPQLVLPLDKYNSRLSGGGSAHNCWTINATSQITLNPPQADGCSNATGGTIGGQVGYRWQAANWVFGLEAQGNWANFNGSNVNQDLTLFPPGGFNDVTKIDAFGLFTGQVGYAFNNILVYGKGGAAVVHDKYSWTLTPVFVSFAPVLFVGETYAAGSETRWGGTVGAGIEYGFAPHWSVALEYDHLFMGTNSVTQAITPAFGGVGSITHNIRQDIDIGTVRVNYTFGGPVIAKY